MKPKDKDDIIFQEELEALDGPIPPHLKHKITEARRALKKDMRRKRRGKEKREAFNFDED